MGPAWKLQRGEVLRGEGEDEERLRVERGGEKWIGGKGRRERRRWMRTRGR